MNISVGIGLAFLAMLCWGFGDFLIQKSTRKVGDWETLFVITFFGTLVLLPFVWQKLPSLFSDLNNFLILLSAGVILAAAALLEFEGFKVGKISVLEPLLSFEIISASFLSFYFIGDRVSWLQSFIIITLVIGLMMVSFRAKTISKRFFLEKGIIFFVVGAFLMGVADFLLGWGSRITDPILANFIINIVMVIISGVYIFSEGKLKGLIRDIKNNPNLILVMSISDNVAWVAYAFAMTLVPIAIATGLSESSIIIAVLLGLFINKEKLQTHQKVGLVVALIAAITLASITR